MTCQSRSPILLTIKAASQTLLPSWVLHQPDFNSLQVQSLKLSAHHKSSRSSFYEAPVKTQTVCAWKLGQALPRLLCGLEKAGSKGRKGISAGWGKCRWDAVFYLHFETQSLIGPCLCLRRLYVFFVSPLLYMCTILIRHIIEESMIKTKSFVMCKFLGFWFVQNAKLYTPSE